MISFEKSVGAIVFRKTNEGIKFLLLDYGENYWGLPKGHVEKSESEIDTLKREAEEETGLNDLRIIDGFKEEIHYFYHAKGEEQKERKKSGKKTFIFKKSVLYLAETKTENIRLSEEHIDFKWLGYDEAVEKISFKSPKKVLEKAKRFLEKSEMQ